MMSQRMLQHKKYLLTLSDLHIPFNSTYHQSESMLKYTQRNWTSGSFKLPLVWGLGGCLHARERQKVTHQILLIYHLGLQKILGRHLGRWAVFYKWP